MEFCFAIGVLIHTKANFISITVADNVISILFKTDLILCDICTIFNISGTNCKKRRPYLRIYLSITSFSVEYLFVILIIHAIVVGRWFCKQLTDNSDVKNRRCFHILNWKQRIASGRHFTPRIGFFLLTKKHSK